MTRNVRSGSVSAAGRSQEPESAQVAAAERAGSARAALGAAATCRGRRGDTEYSGECAAGRSGSTGPQQGSRSLGAPAACPVLRVFGVRVAKQAC